MTTTPGEASVDGPGASSAAAVAVVRFSMTVAAAGFDKDNDTHVDAFVSGIVAGLGLPSNMTEHVSVVFTENAGRLRRLATTYTAEVTINFPEDFDHETVTT